MGLCASETSVGEIQRFTVVFLPSAGIWINQKGNTVCDIFERSTESSVLWSVYVCGQWIAVHH